MYITHMPVHLANLLLSSQHINSKPQTTRQSIFQALPLSSSTFSIVIQTIMPDAGFEDILSQRPFNAPAACPCTAEALCTAPDLAPFFDAQCNVPRHGSRTYSMHGGAGKLPFPARHA